MNKELYKIVKEEDLELLGVQEYNEMLDWLNIATEDINELWNHIDPELKIKKELDNDPLYINIENICYEARLMQTVMLNLEAIISMLKLSKDNFNKRYK
jgi:hypothetical protein